MAGPPIAVGAAGGRPDGISRVAPTSSPLRELPQRQFDPDPDSDFDKQPGICPAIKLEKVQNLYLSKDFMKIHVKCLFA